MNVPPASGAAAAATAADGSGLSLWVRMKGLPARVTSADIEAFFTGLRLASQSPILFKRHADGRTTGAAYVRFASADEAQRAIARDCAIFSERFGQRYVHVYGLAASDMGDLQATALAAAEFEAAAQAAAADGGAEASAVLVRNLPPEAGQAQLATFFSGFRLHPNGLQLGYHGPNTRTGQAFVEFETAEEATRAVATLDRQPLVPEGSKRFVRLEQVTLAEMRDVLALRFGGEGIVRVRGIPPAEVRTLLAGTVIKPGGVHLVVSADNTSGGMAVPAVAASSVFVELASPADALKALEVRLPAAAADAAERGASVRLATRTELRRAHTVPEAQAGLAAVPSGPPLPLSAPFAAMAAALRSPRAQPPPLSADAAAAILQTAGSPRHGSPAAVHAAGLAAGVLAAGGSLAPGAQALHPGSLSGLNPGGLNPGGLNPGAGGGVRPGGGMPPPVMFNGPAAAAAAAVAAAGRSLGSAAGEPVVSAAAGLPPGWRAVPHPGSQAVLCVNDATGEYAWLGDNARLGSPAGNMPAPAGGGSGGGGLKSRPGGTLPSGVSAASWHALASLHSGGSADSDSDIKAASAPAVLRPSPRYARAGPGAPPSPLQRVLSNVSDASAGSLGKGGLNPAASPRSTLGFSTLSSQLSSPRSSVGGSGSLHESPHPSRAPSGDSFRGEGFREIGGGPPVVPRARLPERRGSGGADASHSGELRTRSADVMSSVPAFRPVGSGGGGGGSKGSGELRAASASAMFQRPQLPQQPARGNSSSGGGNGGGGSGEPCMAGGNGAFSQPQTPSTVTTGTIGGGSGKGSGKLRAASGSFSRPKPPVAGPRSEERVARVSFEDGRASPPAKRSKAE